MFTVHGCPRCSFSLRDTEDYYGKYLHCMQCGYHQDVINKIVIPPELKGRMKAGRHGAKYKVKKRKKYDLFRL